MNVAVIPARGGSKRIPRKNIKEFYGKPIIAYSIEAALKSNCFEKVIVSTDDEEIRDVATAYGATVPFLRPDNISGDHATTIEVIKHAIIELKMLPKDNVCCIYPTAPLISLEKVLEGLDLLNNNKLDYAFSATEYSFPIQRAFSITEMGKVKMFYPEHFNTRSQDLQKSYHDAGQFYWGKTESFMNDIPFFSENAMPVLLNPQEVQDIDTPNDWVIAERIYELILKG